MRNIGQSLDSLGQIEKNIKKVGRILGRSQTVDKLHELDSAKDFRNKNGLKVTVGTGKAQLVAKNSK